MRGFASARLIEGDVRAVLATLPAASVQCVITSPPYYALRDYGTAAWEGGDAGCAHVAGMARGDTEREIPGGRGGSFRGGEVQYRAVCGRCGAHRRDQQLGLEPTLDAYLAALVAVFADVRRILRDDGVCFVNIGDSYAGSTMTGGTASKDGGAARVARMFSSPAAPLSNGLKPKDLMLVPFRLALALQADGWYVRSTIIWAKPNPMPESVTDRPTTAHEYVFLLSKRANYYYDHVAVAEAGAGLLGGRQRAAARGTFDYADDLFKTRFVGNGHDGLHKSAHTGTRNARSVWSIATEPFSAARLDAGYVAAPDASTDHFAAFPTKLVEPCLLAGTSAHGACALCGAPWVRVSDSHIEYTQAIHNGTKYGGEGQYQNAAANRHRDGHVPGRKVTETTGWTPTCRCATDAPPVPCTVLDPFVGSGTTALVALRHGRHAIGIDLSAAYLDLARRRIVADSPLFNRVTVERLATDAPVATAAG